MSGWKNKDRAREYKREWERQRKMDPKYMEMLRDKARRLRADPEYRLRTRASNCPRNRRRQQSREYKDSLNAYRRSVRHLEVNRARERRHAKVYTQRYPEKVRARAELRRALETGKIQKPTTCEECGNRCRPHGHHFKGYGFPLEVQWLCRMCHSAKH